MEFHFLYESAIIKLVCWHFSVRLKEGHGNVQTVACLRTFELALLRPQGRNNLERERGRLDTMQTAKTIGPLMLIYSYKKIISVFPTGRINDELDTCRLSKPAKNLYDHLYHPVVSDGTTQTD
ncbi:hypothetical protein RUM43_000285 [Polyplax serrata]|uniref:Uncharacterized protein n=1 Tax=Polyplax serrata TaxID=468196 RepID=A0AAN8XNT7_POLSC